jgi:hypothetical protein
MTTMTTAEPAYPRRQDVGIERVGCGEAGQRQDKGVFDEEVWLDFDTSLERAVEL